ncbi:hypothetical protein TL16_g03367 [Triparma laevis f. inornata]|uniref:Uncharacterized protein n=1 Tax=Triparma laevis f. inornata TaxID=1714386 RepID=A0A9W7A3D2_9STRA|nr:hypothetical protein TL16_g03367 [Triparma laevis f. inornata]
MAKKDIDPTVNDVAFVVMVLLFAGYIYLFTTTVFSMRRAETRQARLKMNRFILRLRQDMAIGGPHGGHLPSSSVPKTPTRNPVLRQIIEAIAHPIPFLASYANVVLTLVVAYIAYTFNAFAWSLICLIVLPCVFGSGVASIFICGMCTFYWDTDIASPTADVRDDVMKNCVIITCGFFGCIAFAVRWRELFFPYLCKSRVEMAQQQMKQTGNGRESSYDMKWKIFGNRASSSRDSRASSAQEEMDPRMSEISDITLDEAIRTPRHSSMFGMEKNLMNPTSPSSDYLELDWHNTIFQHAGARLAYADLVNYMVIISSFMVLLENREDGFMWIASTWLTGGGGGMFWMICRVFLGPNDFHSNES